MTHNLYAKLPNKQEEIYYDSVKVDPEEIENYKYTQPPSIGVKVIRESNWLPEYITKAIWDEYTPRQAIMFSEILRSKAGGHLPETHRENEEIKRIINVGVWLDYWGHQDIGIKGAP